MMSTIMGLAKSIIVGWIFQKLFGSVLFWIAGGAVASFLAYNAGQFVGYNRATDRCNAAALEAQLEAVKRDIEIEKKVTEQVTRERDILDAQAEDLERKVAKYETELAKRKDKCPLTKSDVRRLRNIK